MYYVYMLRCCDGTLYSGMTSDYERRYREHAAKGRKGAKYTAAHEVSGMALLYGTEEKGDAMRLEYRLKQLSKTDKERLIADGTLFEKLLGGVLDTTLFEAVDIPEELRVY